MRIFWRGLLGNPAASSPHGKIHDCVSVRPAVIHVHMGVKDRTARMSASKASSTSGRGRVGGRARTKRKIAWPAAVYDDRRGKLRPADAYEVGRVIVEELYLGERPEHGRRGRTTFRRIAQNEMKGLMSAQALYRCAAIYEMCKALSLEPYWQHVGMSHLSLVLGLTPAQQRRLINATEKQGWSVERLRTEATKLRSTRKKRKGRRPLLRFAKAIHQLDRFIDGRESLLEDLESSDELDREKLEELVGKVNAVRSQLDTVHKTLTKSLRRR